MKAIDLHTHSNASDGTLSPRELVFLAARSGVDCVALTDHDTVDGVAEALEAGREVGIQVVPGVELSVIYQNREMHLLGYQFRPDDPLLGEGLAKVVSFRQERNPQMIKRLQDLGISVTLEEVGREAGGTVIGRPHFAAVLIKKKVVRSMREAFDRFLGQGCPAYVPKDRMTPAEGLGLLRAAGAIPVLAHPYCLGVGSLEEWVDLLSHLRDQGLRGIEAYYPEHGWADIQRFTRLARDCDLAVTAGSDFHGANKPQVRLGGVMANGGTLTGDVCIKMKEWISDV